MADNADRGDEDRLYASLIGQSTLFRIFRISIGLL